MRAELSRDTGARRLQVGFDNIISSMQDLCSLGLMILDVSACCDMLQVESELAQMRAATGASVSLPEALQLLERAAIPDLLEMWPGG